MCFFSTCCILNIYDLWAYYVLDEHIMYKWHPRLSSAEFWHGVHAFHADCATRLYSYHLYITFVLANLLYSMLFFRFRQWIYVSIFSDVWWLFVIIKNTAWNTSVHWFKVLNIIFCIQVRANTELELQTYITRYNQEKASHEETRNSVKANVSTEKGYIFLVLSL